MICGFRASDKGSAPEKSLGELRRSLSASHCILAVFDAELFEAAVDIRFWAEVSSGEGGDIDSRLSERLNRALLSIRAEPLRWPAAPIPGSGDSAESVSMSRYTFAVKATR